MAETLFFIQSQPGAATNTPLKTETVRYTPEISRVSTPRELDELGIVEYSEEKTTSSFGPPSEPSSIGDGSDGAHPFETSPDYKSTYHMIKSNPFHPKNFFNISSKSGRLDSMEDAPSFPPTCSSSTLSTAATIDDLDVLPGITDLVHFDTSGTLGDGTDATVYELIDRRNCEHVAMKLTKRKSGRYRTEIHLLDQLRSCPFVVTLKNVLEDDGVYVLILEKAPMTLEQLLYERCIATPMGEAFAKKIFYDVCRGIEAIHDLGFVHKDIKPENVLLFAQRHEHSLRAKIADFGFSTRASIAASFGESAHAKTAEINAREWSQRVSDKCGTPGFWAPELVANVVEMDFAFKLDVFSAGCTLYRMVCNEMPFALFDNWETKQGTDGMFKLSKVKPTFQVVAWMTNTVGEGEKTAQSYRRKVNDGVNISSAALDLLRSMLRIRPKKRSDIRGCLAHEWFATN